MAYTTFLLGAGASIESIPIVKLFNTRFAAYISILIRHCEMDMANKGYKNLLPFFSTTLLNLGNKTVDTYAYSIYSQKNRIQYEAFKFLLGHYFLFEQMTESEKYLVDENIEIKKRVQQKRDARYYPFLKAIIDERSGEIKDNVRIVSWNYDLQLELAFSDLFGRTIDESFESLYVFPSMANGSRNHFEKAKVVKLNGTAGLFYHRDPNNRNPYHLLCDPTEVFSNNMIDKCCEGLSNRLSQNTANNESLLQYAWENQYEVKEARKKAFEFMADTETLVVVGYSFHDYNTTIDKSIFGNATNLTKIYYQLPQSDFDDCSEDFRRILPDNIVNRISIIWKGRLEKIFVDPIL